MSVQTWTIQDVERTSDALRVKIVAPDGETRLTVLSAGELAALSRKITYDGKEAPSHG